MTCRQHLSPAPDPDPDTDGAKRGTVWGVCVCGVKSPRVPEWQREGHKHSLLHVFRMTPSRQRHFFPRHVAFYIFLYFLWPKKRFKKVYNIIKYSIKRILFKSPQKGYLNLTFFETLPAHIRARSWSLVRDRSPDPEPPFWGPPPRLCLGLMH